MMQGTAYILVRSVVPNPNDRKAFDYWYETDHMPLLMSKIPGLRHAWRFWSTVDPSVHYSFGEFSDMTALRAAAQSDGFKLVLADYDRNWAKKGVTRTRDVMEKVQHLGASPQTMIDQIGQVAEPGPSSGAGQAESRASS